MTPAQDSIRYSGENIRWLNRLSGYSIYGLAFMTDYTRPDNGGLLVTGLEGNVDARLVGG